MLPTFIQSKDWKSKIIVFFFFKINEIQNWYTIQDDRILRNWIKQIYETESSKYMIYYLSNKELFIWVVKINAISV